MRAWCAGLKTIAGISRRSLPALRASFRPAAATALVDTLSFSCFFSVSLRLGDEMLFVDLRVTRRPPASPRWRCGVPYANLILSGERK